jgi:hypothetical protein
MSSKVPNGILANQFWIDAKAYVEAADILIKSAAPSISTPIYFLLGHALELTLKAYLLAKGENADYFFEIKHDLVKAHARASQLGLQVKGEHATALIERLSDFHNVFIFRYPVLTKDEHRLVLRGHLVKASEILDFVASLCTQVHGIVLFARIDAANAGEFVVETWHMGFPEERESNEEKPSE